MIGRFELQQIRAHITKWVVGVLLCAVAVGIPFLIGFGLVLQLPHLVYPVLGQGLGGTLIGVFAGVVSIILMFTGLDQIDRLWWRR